MAEGSTVSKGLVIVFTGDGKGKTTAAIGMGVRAAGHRIPVLCVQFIKGKWKTGESQALSALAPFFELVRMGQGFTDPDDSGMPAGEHRDAAQAALAFAREAIASGRYGMVILDEVLYAINRSLLDVDEVIRLIREKPHGLHLVLTGRHAPPEIIAIADLVTDMRSIKHPYSLGVPAQHGIEF